MTKAFGQTSHSEIMQAFERENRIHTFVEQLPTGEHTKRYQLRISPEKLLTLLDSLSAVGSKEVNGAERFVEGGRLATRQLRAEILATLGLFEEG